MIEEQLRRAAYLNLTQEPSNPLMTLNSRVCDLEMIAESHKDLMNKETLSTKPMNIVLQKVLAIMDDICSDIKTESARIPNILTRVPSVAQRLQFSERSKFFSCCS